MQRILIVDDEHVIADTLTLIFRAQGFEVLTAYSATDAVLAAGTFHPDLVVCDISMPGRSGIELMKDIAHEHPACKIIVLTGCYSNLPSVDEQCRKIPHRIEVLTKPCDPIHLLQQAGAILAVA